MIVRKNSANKDTVKKAAVGPPAGAAGGKSRW
jgi:hypothetical protein